MPQPDIHDKTVATTNSSCRQNDSLALVALYNATNGPTWTNTWDLSQPMESWFGVILDTEGCVQEIDLNYNGLTGEIPVGLMAVSNLQTLNLSFNTSLTGEIPTEIGQLAFLETLNFARTGLSGSIPLEIWNLTNLRNLNLSSTWVGGNIPPEIGNLTELETLNLSSVYAVGGNFNGELPLELGSLTKMRSLSLYNNNFTGVIPPELSNLANLESLRLHNNGFTGSIPAELGSLTKLRFLWLAANNISGQIPPEIGSLQELRQLALYDNNLTGSLPPELGELSELVSLNCRDNQLSGCFPLTLSALCDVLIVDFSNNPGLPGGGDFQSFCNSGTGGCLFPDCASLSMPLNGGSNVSISTDLSWGNVDGVIGYKLTVGTTSGGTDILNSMDVGNVTTYDPGNFPYSTTIYVTITPYNGNGDAQGCTEESFTTEAAPIPGCTDPTAHNYNPAANQDDGSCETCSDGIQNGDETGVDCGGLLCGPCSVANDECGQAIALPVYPQGNCVYADYTTVNATNSGVSPGCGNNSWSDDDVWFVVNSGAGGWPGGINVTVNFQNNNGSGIAIHTGSCGSLTPVACDQTVSVPELGSPASIPPNTDILIQVWTYGNGPQFWSEFEICVEALPTIPGCTDPTAHNYNPAANQDDGSCETCSDGIQNGDETGVDCGGLLCGPCLIDPPSITAFTEGAILDNGCSNEGRPEEGITIPLAWTAVEGADLYNVVLTVTGASVPLLNSNTVLTSSVYECTDCLTNAASVGVKVRARVNGIWTAFSPTVTGYFEPVNTDCPDCVPTVGCSNITAELDPDGNLFLTPGMIDDGTSEACGTGTLSLDQEYFTCDDLGIQAVTLTATDGVGGSASCTAQVTIVPGTDLPAGWSATDIGDPGSGSDYAYNPCIAPRGVFDISTGGYNLFPGNADEAAYVHRPLCGNGGIQADIEAVTNGYAGIMIRESSAPGSKMTAIYSNLGNLLRRETRYLTGGNKSSGSSFAPLATRLRLVRQGDWIRGFYRTPNSSSWQLFHQVYLPMNQCVEMGLAVFTTDPNGQGSATFGRVNWLSSGGGNLSMPDLDIATGEQLPEPRLFPNPTGGPFTLSFGEALQAPATVVLRNPVGQALEQRVLQAGTVQTEWGLHNHPDGLYLLEIRREGQAPILLRLLKTK